MMMKSYVDWFLLKKSIIFFEYRYEHKLIRCGMTRRFRKYKKVDFENLWVTSLLHTTRDMHEGRAVNLGAKVTHTNRDCMSILVGR